MLKPTGQLHPSYTGPGRRCRGCAHYAQVRCRHPEVGVACTDVGGHCALWEDELRVERALAEATSIADVKRIRDRMRGERGEGSGK